MELSMGMVAAVSLIGLFGGCLGGLLGLGGSVFFIPALAHLYGPNQHLYQAAALIVNIAVAISATMRHRGKGTIQADIYVRMGVIAAAASLAGVLASNLVDPRPLAACFGVFLCYAALAEFVRLLRRHTESDDLGTSISARRTAAVTAGVAGGFAAGLLGIGGGAVMVPILQRFGGLPIRQAVATTSAAMILTCIVAAASKNLTLAGLPTPSGDRLGGGDAIGLAVVLAPAAILGASLGAALIYRIPARATRTLLSLLMVTAGVRMIAFSTNDRPVGAAPATAGSTSTDLGATDFAGDTR